MKYSKAMQGGIYCAAGMNIVTTVLPDSETIKATTVLVDPSKKQLSNAHAPEFRYATTDRKVAKVDKTGTVTATSKGTCYIWIYARNGLGVKVKVKVK